jgi:hypothetical protein
LIVFIRVCRLEFRHTSRQMGSILDTRANFYGILIIFVLLGSRDSNGLINLVSLLIALIMVE